MQQISIKYWFANVNLINIRGCEIQEKSTSISIVFKFEEMSEPDDESDKHI